MKVLLDENIPKKLKFDFVSDHEVFTVREMGWSGKKNGDLLGSMLLNGFEVLITMDKNLSYQQNLSKFPIGIFVLHAPNNSHPILQPMVKKISLLLQKDCIGKLIKID